MKHLPELQSNLKNTLPREGITHVIKSLKEALPEDSPKYNLLLQLEAEYRDVKLQMLEGTLPDAEVQRVNNSLRKRLLELIDALEPDDFDRRARRSRLAPEQKVRRGHVLYRIPKTMQIGEETRCLVRIAFDKAMLVEDLDLDEHTQLRADVRISDYMRVQVVDPDPRPAFEIRTTSEPVQLIDLDDFTEWRFYVKPLLPGEHMLELKVCIMLVIDGREHVREKTLEENVVIVSEPVAAEAENAGFRKLDENFAAPCAVGFLAPSGLRLPFGRQGTGLALALLLLAGATTTYAFTPAYQRDWLVTRYLRNNKEAYEEYLQEHTGSPYTEAATYHKARVQESAEELREYLEAYPKGEYAEPALWQLAEIVQEPEAYLEYKEQFPDTRRSRRVERMVQQLEAKVWQTSEATPPPATMNSTKVPPSETVTDAPTSRSTTGADGSDTQLTTVTPPPDTEVNSSGIEQKPTKADIPTREMVSVRGGTFTMGCESAERDGKCNKDEKPLRTVRVSDFFIGKYEVTNEQFAAFLNTEGNQQEGGTDWYDPGSGKIVAKGDQYEVTAQFRDHPITGISWYGAQAYARWLSKATGRRYRLPTEAEWEYAARGGNRSQGYTYAGSKEPGAVAWDEGNSDGGTHPVGQKQPNELGLHDMSGNVWEWVEDCWHSSYEGAPTDGRAWLEAGGGDCSRRVLRGGSWYISSGNLRAAFRSFDRPVVRFNGSGFRLAQDK